MSKSGREKTRNGRTETSNPHPHEGRTSKPEGPKQNTGKQHKTRPNNGQSQAQPKNQPAAQPEATRHPPNPPKTGKPKTQTAHNHKGRRKYLCPGPPSLEQVEDERVVEGVGDVVCDGQRPRCAVPEGSVLAQGCGDREVPVDELPPMPWPRPCKRGKMKIHWRNLRGFLGSCESDRCARGEHAHQDVVLHGAIMHPAWMPHPDVPLSLPTGTTPAAQASHRRGNSTVIVCHWVKLESDNTEIRDAAIDENIPDVLLIRVPIG